MHMVVYIRPGRSIWAHRLRPTIQTGQDDFMLLCTVHSTLPSAQQAYFLLQSPKYLYVIFINSRHIKNFNFQTSTFFLLNCAVIKFRMACGNCFLFQWTEQLFTLFYTNGKHVNYSYEITTNMFCCLKDQSFEA